MLRPVVGLRRAVPAVVDNGLSFDGADDSVEFTSFVPPVRGTIVFWINAATVGPRGRFLGAVDQFEAYIENGMIANQLLSAGSLPNYINSSTTLTANTWYHVALVYDGVSNLQQIYINGALDAEDMTADDRHSIEAKETWLRAGVPPNWIQYEFDRVYKLHKLWVWNSNQVIEL